jgi:hypothetical protein
MDKAIIHGFDFPLGACGVLWDEHRFHELIELVQVQVRETRPDNRSLGNTAVGGIPVPVFQVSGLKKRFDQVYEAFVVNVLPQNGVKCAKLSPSAN